MQRKMSFRTKLLILFLAVGIIPLAVMGGVALWKTGHVLSSQASSHLESIREVKKAFLVDYFEILESQLLILRDDPYIRKALGELSRNGEQTGVMIKTPQWEQLASRFDPHFKDILQDNGWYDLFLVNTDGRIVYTVKRESDLGVVIPESDLKDSSLGYAFNKAQKQKTIISDFMPYGPSGGKPASFAMAPLKDESGQLLGYTAFQVPLAEINHIMQVRAGMGKTGETYLVGPDKLMRSDSYLNPVDHSVAASFANPVLGKVDTTASREALAGKTDTKIIMDYRGVPVLSAYGPIQIDGIDWALMAEIDVAEAFAPVKTLEWLLAVVAFLSVAAIVPTAFIIVKPLYHATTKLKDAAEELQVASEQQSTSTTEQATATSEISTTMEELLRSAKQISEATANAASGTESAHQVSRQGMISLEKAVDGTSLIGTKMENITQNILALSEKSQQMGLVLDIINELADQTTILSYNASIEAAGAGEAGTRFAAVAEQIMNLANKAGDSTKEIRYLVEDVQKSANKTVLISEEGMKAVDEGKSRIRDTAGHFETILKASEENMITAKEVEMTVSQQTTAIDQVTLAVKNVQVTADDVKSSTKQTLNTARQLLGMADELAQI